VAARGNWPMGWSDRDGHLGQGDAGSPITHAAFRSEFMTFSFDVRVSSDTTRKSPVPYCCG